MLLLFCTVKQAECQKVHAKFQSDIALSKYLLWRYDIFVLFKPKAGVKQNNSLVGLLFQTDTLLWQITK